MKNQYTKEIRRKESTIKVANRNFQNNVSKTHEMNTTVKKTTKKHVFQATDKVLASANTYANKLIHSHESGKHIQTELYNNSNESYTKAKPKLDRKVNGDKKTLSKKKFNYTCFIKDENNQYVLDDQKRYNGVIGGVKKYSAHNKTNRNRVTISTKGLHKGDAVRELTIRLPGASGRNNNGHITCPHRRTATRRIYRKLDFFRTENTSAVVLRLEKDPNRTGFIALIKDNNNAISYVPATVNMRVGDKIQIGENSDCLPGNVLTLDKIENETQINNIELYPGSGAKIIRSAGTYGTLVRKESGYAFIRLPSGEERKFLLSCRACVGQVSNENHYRRKIGSAGKAFHMGNRPVNRPIARNPVDHPMGGRTSGGKVFRNKNSKMVKGQKSRKVRKTNSLIYKSRHKQK